MYNKLPSYPLLESDFQFLPYLETILLGSSKSEKSILLTLELDNDIQKVLPIHELEPQVRKFVDQLYNRLNGYNPGSIRIIYRRITFRYIKPRLTVIVKYMNHNGII